MAGIIGFGNSKLLQFNGQISDANVSEQGLNIVGAGSSNIPENSCPYGGMLVTLVFGSEGYYMMQFLTERGATKGWFRVKSDSWRYWVQL